MTNPATIKKQYIILKTWHVQDGGEFIIDEGNSLFGLTFTMGKIAVKNILPTDNVIYSAEGGYEFELSFEHPVYNDYVL